MLLTLGQYRDNSRLCGNRTSGGLLDAVGRDRAVSAQVVYKLDISKLPPVVIAHNEARLCSSTDHGGGKRRATVSRSDHLVGTEDQ